MLIVTATLSPQTFTLERSRVAHRPEGEGSFNILYQLVAGADEDLRGELLLNASIDPDSSNLYVQPHEDVSLAGPGCVRTSVIPSCVVLRC